MAEEAHLHHPAGFHRLCDEAIEQFRALAAADPFERGMLVRPLRELLQRIDDQLEEMDIREPGFSHEQGLLVDAATALQSIDLDRGGPHVARYVERAIADIRRVAG